MFNLSKHAQVLDGALPALEEATDSAANAVDPAESPELDVEQLTGGMTEEESAAVQDAAVANIWNKIIAKLGQMPPEVLPAIRAIPGFEEWAAKKDTAGAAATAFLEENRMTGAEVPVGQAIDYDPFEQKVLARAQDIRRKMEENAAQQQVYNQQAVAFNLKNYKTAQMGMEMPMEQPMAAPMPAPMDPSMAAPEQPEQPEGELGRFPVQNVGDFISKFVDDLLNFENMPGSPNYAAGKQAAEEIRDAVSPGYEEEANSVLESVMQLDITEKDKAANSLIKLYEVLLPRMLKADEAAETMEPVMSEKNTDAIKGIVRYSLTDSVLNNQKLPEKGMVKTAADQFGQQYLLYGPTEKRICPKLRGKNLSVGDVVSEYTCRMHCEDGIVIDDNKTICGEALWRANVMDKFSTEYKNEDGETVGGYINKRFEVNRNIPEETRRRLNPGETRKPKPPSMGSTESRLQDMRSKEGQARGYRPNVNTGDAFEWCHDVDQNNVDQSQSTRDSREEASGHQLVQYKNRDQGENNPKVAFNLKQHKTAQTNPFSYEQPVSDFGALNEQDDLLAPEDTGQLREEEIKSEAYQDAINAISTMQPEEALNFLRSKMESGGLEESEHDNIVDQSGFQQPNQSGFNYATNKKQQKTAQKDPYVDSPRPTPGSHDEYLQQATINRMKAKKCPECNDTTCRCGTGDVGDPKKASKKQQKTADMPGESPDLNRTLKKRKNKNPLDTGFDNVNQSAMVQSPADIDKSTPGLDGGKPMKKKQNGFNLRQFKTAMSSSDIKDRGVKDVYLEELLKSKPEKIAQTDLENFLTPGTCTTCGAPMAARDKVQGNICSNPKCTTNNARYMNEHNSEDFFTASSKKKT